ncbi:hypothetical protein U1Q18_035598 [Sarracenia purpurea var. burkii]
MPLSCIVRPTTNIQGIKNFNLVPLQKKYFVGLHQQMWTATIKVTNTFGDGGFWPPTIGSSVGFSHSYEVHVS